MKRTRGFTLIELAIVLVIVTILIGGLAMPLSAQIQARRIAETNKTLEEARHALVGYVMSHPSSGNPDKPYLPCPDTNGDGLENRTGDICTNPDGWFPWADLGTGAQDAWGNRLRYSVENREYADRSKGLPNLALLTPPYATLNLKRICRSSACTSFDAVYLPAVVFSHGPNGWGALNINGNTLAAPTSADELENTNAGPSFVSRTPSKAGDASGEFDDLVVWVSDGVLRSRVCPAGGCP
ncbi:MAG: type II secretion system GspH family protein [Gammaproteobacteria bacterium]|nr:type II secretion system GspH family protein [Gammaproteobacteria bacterium]